MSDVTEVLAAEKTIWNSWTVSLEMPKPRNNNVYYPETVYAEIGHNSIRMGIQPDESVNTTGVYVAAGILVVAFAVMWWDFAIGSVLGMPAFAYLLAVARDRRN